MERPSILPSEGQLDLVERMLSGSQAKTAYALRMNCETLIGGGSARGQYVEWQNPNTGATKLVWKAGNPEFLHCSGFLTLTVGDFVCEKHGEQVVKSGTRCPACGVRMQFRQVWDASEASRRINNLRKHVLAPLFGRAIIVSERHKSGALHFHVIGRLASGEDIRTGFDFKAVRQRDYLSVSPWLRETWAWLRDKLPEYGFGRAELTPIEKDSEAVASYVSKYIEKNVCNRTADDHRKKLVRYHGWPRSERRDETGAVALTKAGNVSTKGHYLTANDFAWATPRAKAWRGKTRQLAGLIDCHSPKEFASAVGPRWAFHVTALIQAVSNSPVPFMIWDFEGRELCRSELVKRSGVWMKRREEWHARRAAGLDGFRESFAEIRAGMVTGCRAVATVAVPRWNPTNAISVDDIFGYARN